MHFGFKKVRTEARVLYRALKNLETATTELPVKAALDAIAHFTQSFGGRKLSRLAKKAVFLSTKQHISSIIDKLEQKDIATASKTLTLAKGRFGTKKQGIDALVTIAQDLESPTPTYTKDDLESIAKTLSAKQITKAIQKTNPKTTPLKKTSLLSALYGRVTSKNLGQQLGDVARKITEIKPVLTFLTGENPAVTPESTAIAEDALNQYQPATTDSSPSYTSMTTDEALQVVGMGIAIVQDTAQKILKTPPQASSARLQKVILPLMSCMKISNYSNLKTLYFALKETQLPPVDEKQAMLKFLNMVPENLKKRGFSFFIFQEGTEILQRYTQNVKNADVT
jgi:hypothetical protein